MIAPCDRASDISLMKLKHYDHDGRARFITFSTHHRLPLLTNKRYREIVIDAIRRAREAHKFRLLGYVIMPEHVHLVIVPGLEAHVGEIVGEIKMRSASAILELIKASGQRVSPRLTVFRNGIEKSVLWQRRCYDRNCRSDEEVWEKLNYCHNNPVKRGLVSGPEKWVWSSFRWYQGDPAAVLEMDVSG